MEFPGSGDTFAFATLRAVAAYPGIYRHYPRPADGRSRWTETSSRQCGAQRQHRSEIFSFIQSPARRSVGNNREWTIMDANSTRIHFVSIRVNLFKLRVKEFGLVSIKGMRFF